MISTIKKTLDDNIKIIDSAKTTAEYIQNFLIHNSLVSNHKENNNTKIMVTDKTLLFEQFAQNILSNNKLDILEIAI